MKWWKMNSNDVKGMAVYFSLAMLIGVDVAILALIIKENSDRITYYEGKWNKGDIVRGCAAIGIAWAVLITIRIII